MNTKYITPRKSDGKWVVKNSKAGKATRVFDTQVKAIDHAAHLNSTKTIMVQGKNGQFRKLVGWDQTNTKADLKKVPAEKKVETKQELNWFASVNQKYPWLIVMIILFLFALLGIIGGLYFGGLI